MAHKDIVDSICHQWKYDGGGLGVVRGQGTRRLSATVGVLSGVRYRTVWQDG